MCGTGLKNTQYLTDQDPYVKVFMQPGPMSEDKTRALPGGGTKPQWEDIDNNRLQLDLKEGATQIDVEIWNSNLIADDLIGKASVPLEQVKAVSDQPYEVGLDTGGTITIRFHYPLTEEERVAKGAGGLLDGAFDERKSKVEFQAAVASWRSGDE